MKLRHLESIRFNVMRTFRVAGVWIRRSRGELKSGSHISAHPPHLAPAIRASRSQVSSSSGSIFRSQSTFEIDFTVYNTFTTSKFVLKLTTTLYTSVQGLPSPSHQPESVDDSLVAKHHRISLQSRSPVCVSLLVRPIKPFHGNILPQISGF